MDTAAKKQVIRTPLTGSRMRAQKSNLIEIDDAISDIFQDATGQNTGLQMKTAKHRSRTNNKNEIAQGSSEINFSAIKGETGNQIHNHYGETAENISLVESSKPYDHQTNRERDDNQTALSDLDYEDLQPHASMANQTTSSFSKRGPYSN